MKYLIKLSVFLQNRNFLFVNQLARLMSRTGWLNNKLQKLAANKFVQKILNISTEEKLHSKRLPDLIAKLLCVFIVFFVLMSVFLYILHGVYSAKSASDTLIVISTLLAGFSAVGAAMVALNGNIKNEEKNRKDIFDRRYTLLLEQHNRLLVQVVNYLDTAEGKQFKDLDNVKNKNGEIFSAGGISNEIRGHYIFSPYMRVLYHLLKGIAEEFSPGDRFTYVNNEEKNYSNIVRSLIPNHVLSLIAINSSFFYSERVNNLSLKKEMNEIIYNDYHKYFILLRRYDFFEHIDLPEEAEGEVKKAIPSIPVLSADSLNLIYYIKGESVLESSYLILNDGLKSDNLKRVNLDIMLFLKKMKTSQIIRFFFLSNYSGVGYAIFKELDEKITRELLVKEQQAPAEMKRYLSISQHEFLGSYAKGRIIKALHVHNISGMARG